MNNVALTADLLKAGFSAPIGSPGTIATIADYAERAGNYAYAAKASNTRRAYATDMADFGAFAVSCGAGAVPASWQLVAAYATHLADRGLTIATIRRRMVGISQAHKSAGFDSPTSAKSVRDVIAGIARTRARHDGDGLKVKRDRALLLLGFAIAARRSELAALDVEDLQFELRGLVVTIRRSKTDQEALGAEIGVPFIGNVGLCAARAVRECLEASGNTSGAPFRPFRRHGNRCSLKGSRISGDVVAALVARTAASAGIAA